MTTFFVIFDFRDIRCWLNTGHILLWRLDFGANLCNFAWILTAQKGFWIGARAEKFRSTLLVSAILCVHLKGIYAAINSFIWLIFLYSRIYLILCVFLINRTSFVCVLISLYLILSLFPHRWFDSSKIMHIVFLSVFNSLIYWVLLMFCIDRLCGLLSSLRS